MDRVAETLRGCPNEQELRAIAEHYERMRRALARLFLTRDMEARMQAAMVLAETVPGGRWSDLTPETIRGMF